MNVKISIHKNNIDIALKNLKKWNVPDMLKKDLLKFIDEMGLGKVNQGKKISDSTLIKYLRVLRRPLEFINKNLTKTTVKDIERFEKALSSNDIQSWKKKPYSNSMRVDMRLALKIIFRWKIGVDKSQKLVGWLETKDKVKTPDFLTEKEITKLFEACKSPHERYLISVLFSGGMRAEEFHNIRYEDIQLPERNDSFVKVTLKEEYSKTVGRVISLYWDNALKSVHEFIRIRESEGIKAAEPIYNYSYDSSRAFLRRIGQRVLGKHVYAHLIRHSAATHLASKLNRQQLCYFFGWKFSSNMPDVYISRAGMNNKEVDDKIINTELGELKSRLQKESFDNKMQREEFQLKITKMQEERKKDKELYLNDRKNILEYLEKVRSPITRILTKKEKSEAHLQVLEMMNRTPKT